MNKTSKKVFLCCLLSLVAIFCLIALLWLMSWVAIVVLNKVFNVAQASVKVVTIREGLTAVEISNLLRNEGVFANGETLPQELDGYLFPDTYEFYVPSSLDFVVKKISGNFNKKVIPNIPELGRIREVITVASILEEEASSPDDRRIIAGIIWKRLKTNMYLQVDAAICYTKPAPCYPVRAEDLELDSPYNTYLYKGLPPGPISNPGLGAIKASLSPRESPYWYYIADPKTGRTVFGTTLEEHNKNIAKYLN